MGPHLKAYLVEENKSNKQTKNPARRQEKQTSLQPFLKTHTHTHKRSNDAPTEPGTHVLKRVTVTPKQAVLSSFCPISLLHWKCSEV